MRLLGLDLETTGLDTANDRITELGLVLWDTDKKCLLAMKSYFMIDDGLREKFKNPEIAAMVKRLCNLDLETLEEFGLVPGMALSELEELAVRNKVDYILAHNGENFDKPFTYAELTRHNVKSDFFRQLPWLDTKMDIPHATPPDSNRLRHLALDCGFINPFEHRAIFDVLTMLRVLSNYDLSEVVEYSKIPFVTVRAVVTYDDRDLAKAQRYSWEKLGDKSFPKCWVKRIKQNKLQDEIKACKFQVVVIN
jgi:DNA polymerase-3 subunit epsilon